MRICTPSPRNTKTQTYCRPADAQACDAESQWSYIDAVAGPPKVQVTCSPRISASCPRGQMPEHAHSPRYYAQRHAIGDRLTIAGFITSRRSQKATTPKSMLSWIPRMWSFLITR